MRVLLIDQFGELGGGQRCLLEAAAGFAARGWELHAAVPGGPLASELGPLVKSTVELPCGPFASGRKSGVDLLRFGAQLPRQASVISRIVRNSAIDVLYVNGPRALPAAALARVGRPVVFHAHWTPPQRSAAALTRFALRTCGATVLASSQFVARAFKQNDTRVIHNGVAVGRVPDRSPEVRHIAVLGRIAPEKGQLEFAGAARIVAVSKPHLRFTVCGAPMFSDTSYLETVRAAAGVAVAFPGWTTDVRGFLGGVDLLVVPSQPIDNIPRVILEAFAAGVPVLAFASGGIPELIQHGETGLLVDKATAEGLAEAMLEAVNDAGRLHTIAARAHARCESHYTLGRFQSEVCEALEAAARRQRKPLHSAGASAAA